MSVGAGKGKVEIKDVRDKTAENDPQYLKVVREIQEGNTRYNRGTAFDRQDLLYLSDFKDAEHQKELEIRDLEASEFAKLRSRLDGASEAAAGAVANGGGTTLRVAVKDKQQLRPASKLLPAVKVLSPRDGLGGALSREGSLKRALSREGSLKRARTESLDGKEGELLGTSGSYGSRAAGGAGAVVQPGIQEQPSVGRPAMDLEDSWQPQAAIKDSSDAGDGLQGLLGGYGSSSEEDGQKAEPVRSGQGAQMAAARSGSGLPSAAELLGMPSGLLSDLEAGKPPPNEPAAVMPEQSATSDDDE